MDSNCTGSDFCETGSDTFWTGSDIFVTGNDIDGSGSKFGVAESEIYGTRNDLNRKIPWFLEIFEIFVFQSRFCPWIRSKFKNRPPKMGLGFSWFFFARFGLFLWKPSGNFETVSRDFVKMAAAIQTDERNIRKPVLINKIDGSISTINEIKIIPKDDGIIAVSDDR